MEELFKEISKEENCEVDVIYEKAYVPYIFLPFFMRENGIQIKALRLKVIHKKQTIEVVYALSNNHFGTISCKLEKKYLLPNFKITNRSHYLRLFNKNLNILKVECKDVSFTKLIEKILWDLKIEDTARNYQFEPTISCTFKDNLSEVKASYHLAFPEKKYILRQLIEFHKKLIDYAISNQ